MIKEYLGFIEAPDSVSQITIKHNCLLTKSQIHSFLVIKKTHIK